MIGLAREVQAITVDPFPASDMKRMKEYDCGPQARAAAQLSPQRLRAERPRLLSDSGGPSGKPPSKVGTARTRIAAGRSRSVRRQRRAPPWPDALWDRREIERSLPGKVSGSRRLRYEPTARCRR